MTPQESLIKTVMEAWGRADLAPLRACMDDNIVWKSAATQVTGSFRFGGIYRGRAEVIAHLAKQSTEYFFSSCETKEIISSGEIVWALFDIRGLYLHPGSRNGRPIEFESAFRFRVCEQKLKEGQAFFDTMALLAQQAECDEPV